VAENLDSLTGRFFATAGIVSPAGYQAIEVLLDKWAQPYFGGREYLLLAFSPEAAHEHREAELITYGNPLLDNMTEAANTRGDTAHFHLGYLNPTTGRTLEKVRAQVHISGHIVETGKERVSLFHHAIFRFKVSLLGEEREEFFRDIAVDLHLGWTTNKIDSETLRLNMAPGPAAGRGMELRLSLAGAFQKAVERMRGDLKPPVAAYQARLAAAGQAEQKQVSEHYDALIARLEAGKGRKGADPVRLDARIRATRADKALRLDDLQKRYELGIEIRPVQAALVSYLKAVVPLSIQQGKEIKQNVAVWDALTHEGYLAPV
jgi:hypothetical protein